MCVTQSTGFGGTQLFDLTDLYFDRFVLGPAVRNNNIHRPTYIVVGKSPHIRKHIRWKDTGHALSSRPARLASCGHGHANVFGYGRPHVCS